MVRHAVWVSILISPLCVDFSHYADESCSADVELSEDAHDFEGELDYLAGVKDICGGLR